MADDTVERARYAVAAAVGRLVDESLVAHEPADYDAIVSPLIDALIAAVRAESEAASDERAHKLRALVDEARDEIQRLKLKHADGYERGPALTDADVDAFLAAVDETDPERVERIRKLFNKKLKQTLDAHPGLAMRAPKPDPE